MINISTRHDDFYRKSGILKTCLDCTSRGEVGKCFYQPAPKISKMKFHLVPPVINKMPLSLSDADFNPISSAWANCSIGKKSRVKNLLGSCPLLIRPPDISTDSLLCFRS